MASNDYRPGRTLIIFGVAVVLLFVLMATTSTFTPRLGLDLRGGTTITLTARAADGSSSVPRENLEMARTIIQSRVDSLGVGEASVTVQGDNQIEVAVPNVNSDELVELVGTTARLAFRPVIAVQQLTTGGGGQVPQLPGQPADDVTVRPTSPAEQQPSLDERLNYQPTEQDQVEFQRFTCRDSFPDVEDQPLFACDADKTVKYLLGPVVVSGQHVTDANAGIPQGRVAWTVGLKFDDEGASQFSDATAALAAKQAPQNQFAIVLDHEVVSAPKVDERIAGGQAEINGPNINETEARNLASTLRYGALPVDLETSSVNTVSPTLGGNQMSAGIIAGLIGLALVVVYSLVYYRGLTVVVVGSLVAAAVVTYGVIVLLGSAVGFALNLPGLAGAIVAIGVTADSFIVYFERIRDDIRDGHRLRHSIESGWKKARNTIIMADGVQLLAAIVLYFLAIGAVKGFAFTLGVTTAIDLVLVVFFTHPLMSVLGRTRFFGEGHRFSGFDPEHLGVSRSSMLGRRRAAAVEEGVQA